VAVGKERLEEVVSSEAEVLVTACPLCIENFTEAKQAGKFNIQIKNLPTFPASCPLRTIQ
jgi:Fe-S oxidoreductase